MTRNTIVVSILLLLLLALVTSFAVSRKSAVLAFMSSQHILPEPERLTELYFTDHLKLPEKIKKGSSLPISFTIHNVEYEPMRYTYHITATIGESSSVITEETITLKNDETKGIEKVMTVGDVAGRMKVEVYLVEKQQAIHFWVEVVDQYY